MAQSQLIFVVLTVSDTCSLDKSKDRSGPRLIELIGQHFPLVITKQSYVPDVRQSIELQLTEHTNIIDVALIITTGGTGFATRDVTPEATRAVIEKECTQMANYTFQASFETNKFAALTRGIFGIRDQTLIMNFPGSVKAVTECFNAVRALLPHALALIRGDDNINLRLGSSCSAYKHSHSYADASTVGVHAHNCGGNGTGHARDSPYPMIAVLEAQDIIFEAMQGIGNYYASLMEYVSPVNIPPFRASIKDGYAMTSTGFEGAKRVLGHIFAGDKPLNVDIKDDECYKICTGAPVPKGADCVIQVEDTKVLTRDAAGAESLVEILAAPKPNLDIRPIGSDLQRGSKLFPVFECSPAYVKSVLAAVGRVNGFLKKPTIGIVSTGAELLSQSARIEVGKIYDSNTTMLVELLKYFGFECSKQLVLSDDLPQMTQSLKELFDSVDIIISSGGVSMGDKDYIKLALEKLQFKIHFGRVDLKPGKPSCFASKERKFFFGLPGNPVSAFVTFHLFALPGIRFANGWTRSKCILPQLKVKFEDVPITLDSRPEYARASITSRGGVLFARIQGNQISSCLQSIVGADVLLHLPARTNTKQTAFPGEVLTASVLRYDFITNYE